MNRITDKKFVPIALGLLLLAGLAFRVWGAWTIQFSPNSDFGIVALMARHMAEGVGFPVFFYGQPYMGSVEPAISAILCRLFGISGFMVCMGTALLAFFALPLVYSLARRLAGSRGALIALLYLLVGSNTNFHYSVAPRGGYMSMLVMGLACLLLAVRIARRLATGERLLTLEFLAIGLCAGIGWWSNQLVFVFLLPSALILLGGLFRSAFWTRVPVALAGFFAGSAPWWWWNVKYGWASFGFRGSLGSVPVTEGVASFWWQFLASIDSWPATQPLNAIRIALTAIALGFLFFNLGRQIRRREWNDSFWTRLAGALVVLAMIATYSTSHYARHNASRYVLPIIPIFALALSDAVSTVVRSCSQRPFLVRLLAGLAIFLAIPPHYRHLPGMTNSLASDKAAWHRGIALADLAAKVTDGVLYADYAHHWINFASSEKAAFSTTPADRYAPYTLRAAETANPAFLQNHRRIHAFVHNTRGKCRETRDGSFRILHDLKPPDTAWRYIDPDVIRVECPPLMGLSPQSLLDDVLDGAHEIRLDPESPFVWTATFEKPVHLAGLRYLTPDGAYPHNISVSLLGEESGTWREVSSSVGNSAWFWSGLRVFPAPFQYFPELRFPSFEEASVAVRVRFSTSADEQRVHIGNWLFLEELPGQTVTWPETETLGQVRRFLTEHGVNKLYAPRWVSERLAVQSETPFELVLPHAYNRTVQDIPRHDDHAPAIQISAGTGLLCWEQDAPRTRRVLNQFTLSFEEHTLAPWHLFVLQDPPPGLARDFTVLRWNETGCWAADIRPYAKTRAQQVYQQQITEDADAGIERLRMVLDLYPKHQPALEEIVKKLTHTGRSDEAAMYSQQLAAITKPGSALPIRFPNGAVFLGITMADTFVSAGKSFDITYHWECPPKGNHERWAFFVHLKSGDRVFQDDHIFMDGIPSHDIVYQPFKEVFAVTRRVHVPPGIAPGKYHMQVGLYDRKTGKRLKPRTTLPHKRGAVSLPLSITVPQPTTH